MDEIGKLLFNALASKKAVGLPDIGAFRTEYIPSGENADGSITPPRNQVAFSASGYEDAVCITTLMQHEPGIESPADRYTRWLAKAIARGPAVIDGIGVVNNGVFTPYESLINALNPIPAAPGAANKPSAKKGLNKAEKGWLVFIIICVIILAGGWTWWNLTEGKPFGENGWKPKNPAVTDNMERIPEHTGAITEVETEEYTVSETVGESAPVIDEPAPKPTATPAGQAAPGFYVVGNVFAIPENADKYIADMKKKYPDLDYMKHPFKGKTLVSLYHSTDRREANRRRIKIEDRILTFELWLYEVQ